MFESESGKIDEALHNILLEKGCTLSLAESMTGGAALHRLTLRPGASRYLQGGIVCYSNKSKIDLLQVDPLTIQREGAVSEKVACQMAEGALKAFDSDYSLAITGIGGPSGGSEAKPVGTMWCALSSREATHAWHVHAKGSREMIIEYGVNALFVELYLKLKKSIIA